jgi:hypothetical protein
MTTVVPKLMLLAGNWNNNVFPTPVAIAAKKGLLYFIMGFSAIITFARLL